VRMVSRLLRTLDGNGNGNHPPGPPLEGEGERRVAPGVLRPSGGGDHRDNGPMGSPAAATHAMKQAAAIAAPTKGTCMASETNAGGFGSLIRDLGLGLSDLFGGGKPDADRVLTLEVLFGLLGYLAKLDSLVTSHEAEFINNMMDTLKLSVRERQVAAEAMLRGRNREIELVAELQRFRGLHPIGSAEVERLYDALLRLAAADERLRPKERQFLEVVTVELGYTLDDLDRRLAELAHG
jgi:DnaJ like chaperone protein